MNQKDKRFYLQPARRLAGLAIGVATVLLGAASVSAAPQYEAVPGEYVVKFRTRAAATERLARKDGDLGIRALGDGVTALVRMGSGAPKSLNSVHALRAELGDVVYVEPNYIYRAFRGSPPPVTPPPTDEVPARRDRSSIGTIFPNDAKFGDLWGMANDKQNVENKRGDGRADAWAPQAWKIFTGSRDVVVAVIDTGIDYRHPDLRANMWRDGDKLGYNAINDTFDPMDDNAHGTHCAGTIGGVGSNSRGVAGVNWNVRLMGVKFLSASGGGTSADAVKGIRWAVDNGADILSNSWGGGPASKALEDAIRYANSKGVLFVAAAGNDGKDNDRTPSYPANYKIENVISVAASDNQDKLAGFSNYGKTTVHLAAPGVGIMSTTPGDTYQSFSGTSMATPHVAGAAALLLGYKPGLTAAQLKAQILKTVEVVGSLKQASTTGGRLNLYDMLTK